MRALIRYGSHHQFEAIVPLHSLGLVQGRLVRGFTRTGPNSFIYGTELDNAEVVLYF